MTRARSIVLTAGAVVGTLCLMAAVAGVLAGVKPLIFRSGSMGPEIPAGSLGLARPVEASRLEVGDVVSVVNGDGVRVTHRVAAISGTGESRHLTLKGDANSSPDAETYVVTEADRVFWSAAVLGYVVNWLGSPHGLFALGGMSVGVLVLGFGGGPGRKRGGRRRATASIAAPVVASVLLLQMASGTAAAFSDSAVVTSGAVTAHHVQPPDGVACAASGEDATFSWLQKDPRYDYEISLYRQASSNVLVSRRQVTGAAVSQRYNRDNDFGLSGSLIGSAATYYFVADVRSWLSGTSAPSRWESAVRDSTQRIRISVSCTIFLVCTVGNPTCVARS